MAFGVITSAAGASGIAMPLIIEALLDRYGYRTTRRAIAVAMIVASDSPDEKQATSLTGKRRHQNSLVICFKPSFPRILLCQFYARSRFLLSIPFLTFLR